MTLRDFYIIAKPGIIYGNLFVAVGAFFLGSHWHINAVHLLAMSVGLGLIIACGGVFNNYFDRDIDAAMARTKTRPSVTGALSARVLILYASALGLLGSLVLYLFVNNAALYASLFGLFAYLVLYTFLAKRGSELGTLVGSISGAMPPVIGYVAASNSIDVTSLVLFLMLVFWQMPHAYAIALFRFDDYKAANIPVLPVACGILRTKIEMLIYVVLFGIASVYLTYFGATGMVYGIIAALSSLLWLALSIFGFFTDNWKRWGRRMFFASLIILMLLFTLMALDSTGLVL